MCERAPASSSRSIGTGSSGGPAGPRSVGAAPSGGPATPAQAAHAGSSSPHPVVHLIAGAPDTAGDPALLEQDPRPAPRRMHQGHQCYSCGRADTPVNELRLVLIARDGLLYEVCSLCFLIAEVCDLATGGNLSPRVVGYVEEQLSELYGLLRLDLEERIQRQRDGES